MKTLVAGAVAVLLGSAALTFAALPAAADETPAPDPITSTDPPPPFQMPVVHVTCVNVSVYEAGSAGRVRISSTATDPEAGAPWPADDQSALPNPMVNFSSLYNFSNPAWSWNWTVDVWDMGGDHWTASGTTTPCPSPPYIKGYVAPAKPTVNTTCGATLDDIHFPATRHVTYWHDAATWYATVETGWVWGNGALGPPHTGWIMADGVPSTQSRIVKIDGYDLLKPPAGCAHTVPGPYDPQPTSPRPTGPRLVTAPPPATVAPAPTADPTAATTTPAPPTSATPESTDPSPLPTPPATPAAQSEQRVATTTGLGVAGGLVGACALAMAGVFVVRRRLRPETNVVVLDEPTGDEPVD